MPPPASTRSSAARTEPTVTKAITTPKQAAARNDPFIAPNPPRYCDRSEAIDGAKTNLTPE
jgi:hypothetical protein